MLNGPCGTSLHYLPSLTSLGGGGVVAYGQSGIGTKNNTNGSRIYNISYLIEC